MYTLTNSKVNSLRKRMVFRFIWKKKYTSRPEICEAFGFSKSTVSVIIRDLEFENGVIATIENNWILPNSHPHWNYIKLNISGSKGMINMDLTNNQAFERYLEYKSDHPDFLIMPIFHGKPMGFAH